MDEMQKTTIITKRGNIYEGELRTFRPEEGYMSLLTHEGVQVVDLKQIKTVSQQNHESYIKEGNDRGWFD